MVGDDDAMVCALTVFSSEHIPLYVRWLETLPEGFIPFAKLCGEGVSGIEHYIEFLEDREDGEVVMCCDADVRFLRRGKQLVDAAIDRFAMGDIDMWACDGVGKGLFFVKNSDRVRAFLEGVVGEGGNGVAKFEEAARGVLRVDRLPCGMVVLGEEVGGRGALVHCATGGSVEDKIRQQERVEGALATSRMKRRSDRGS